MRGRARAAGLMHGGRYAARFVRTDRHRARTTEPAPAERRRDPAAHGENKNKSSHGRHRCLSLFESVSNSPHGRRISHRLRHTSHQNGTRALYALPRQCVRAALGVWSADARSDVRGGPSVHRGAALQDDTNRRKPSHTRAHTQTQKHANDDLASERAARTTSVDARQ